MNNLPINGVSENTPKTILFGAGTVHVGLKYNSATKSWNFKESLYGATSGGSKLDIIPELKTIELDNVLVKAKGLDVKIGETAKMEINFAELTQDIIKTSTLGEIAEDDEIEGFTKIQSKSKISTGDYLENIAFVGVTLEEKPIIAILPNALCTSGFSNEGKTKENSVGKYTFECYQELGEDLTKLPWEIYYPSEATTTSESQEENQE